MNRIPVPDVKRDVCNNGQLINRPPAVSQDTKTQALMRMAHLIERDGTCRQLPSLGLYKVPPLFLPPPPPILNITMSPPNPGPHAIINKKSGAAFTASDGPDPRAITGSQYDGTREQKV